MKLDSFRRWVPLLAVLFLAARIIARAMGRDDIDAGLLAFGNLLGLEAFSPVDFAELSAAFAAAAGVVLKIAAVIRNAMGGPGGNATGDQEGAVGHPRVIAPAIILLALLPSLATAQESTPSPPPAVEITLHGGAMQTAERGQPDKRDFVYRLSVTVPAPSGLTLFGRADYTRTQDGGDLIDPKTFRSVEGLVGARKDVGAGFAVTAFCGATWNRDAHVEPTDPRLYTAALGFRYSVPGRGYVVAAVGHHGPVGGSALLGSIVYDINAGASWFFDAAVPLDANRFRERPYTVRVGISARLKGWRL